LFKAQKRSPANVELPDACLIHKQIQNEMPWAPLLSENFIRDYKAKEFCGICGPVVPPAVRNPFPENSRTPSAAPTVDTPRILVSVMSTYTTTLHSSKYVRKEEILESSPLA